MKKHAIGPATLYRGDCLEVMAKMEPNSVDAIITDPPYGQGHGKWDSIIPLDKLWPLLTPLVSGSGAIIMTACQPFTSRLVLSNQDHFRYCLVWDKVAPGGGAFLHAKRKPMQVHEDIVVFSKGVAANGGKNLMPYFPIMTELEKPVVRVHRGSESRNAKSVHQANLRQTGYRVTNYTHSYPKSIVRVSNAHKKGSLHPTQKPVDLMAYLIETYVSPGGTVLDFAMGSGSTGVAAIRLGRRFIGIEKETRYFNMAKRRLEEAATQPRKGARK